MASACESDATVVCLLVADLRCRRASLLARRDEEGEDTELSTADGSLSMAPLAPGNLAKPLPALGEKRTENPAPPTWSQSLDLTPALELRMIARGLTLKVPPLLTGDMWSSRQPFTRSVMACFDGCSSAAGDSCERDPSKCSSRGVKGDQATSSDGAA